MRLRARTDTNHREIVNALRNAGASVEDLSRVGRGCPDLCVGLRGQNFLLEIKSGRHRLNAEQVEWRKLWSGHVDIVYSVEDALRAVGLL